jgi:hypothetical protein
MNCGLSVWNFDILSSKENDINNYDDMINDFLFFSNRLRVNFFLDLKKTTYSFIEKIIYDTVKFHCNRLHIDLNDKAVSFWSKSTEYNFEYIHMHIDHCDYEARMFGTEIKKPIFTTLLYFNDNECPTLVTDVTREMCNKKDFFNNNNKVAFSFPKSFKNIAFDSGNYYHGESYLSDYEQKERRVIVIAIWDTDNKPSHIPYFQTDLFNYFSFSFFYRTIDETRGDEYEKDKKLVTFENTDNNIITIKINDSELINDGFFEDLLSKREKKTMYRFHHILKKIKNPDTIILDFSNIIK